MKAIELSMAFRAFALATYEKMAAGDQAKAFKAYMAIKKELQGLEEMQQEVTKKLRSARLDELDEKKAELDAVEEKELAELKSRYEEAVDLALKEAAEKEVSPEFERLSEEAFAQLMAGSKLNFSQADLLHEVLVKEPESQP